MVKHYSPPLSFQNPFVLIVLIQIMLRIFIKVDLHDLSNSSKLKTEIKHSLLSQQENSE